MQHRHQSARESLDKPRSLLSEKKTTVTWMFPLSPFLLACLRPSLGSCRPFLPASSSSCLIVSLPPFFPASFRASLRWSLPGYLTTSPRSRLLPAFLTSNFSFSLSLNLYIILKYGCQLFIWEVYFLFTVARFLHRWQLLFSLQKTL